MDLAHSSPLLSNKSRPEEKTLQNPNTFLDFQKLFTNTGLHTPGGSKWQSICLSRQNCPQTCSQSALTHMLHHHNIPLPLSFSMSSRGSAMLPSLLLRTRISDVLEAQREWAGDGSPLSDRCLVRSGRMRPPPAPAPDISSSMNTANQLLHLPQTSTSMSPANQFLHLHQTSTSMSPANQFLHLHQTLSHL